MATNFTEPPIPPPGEMSFVGWEGSMAILKVGDATVRMTRALPGGTLIEDGITSDVSTLVSPEAQARLTAYREEMMDETDITTSPRLYYYDED